MIRAPSRIKGNPELTSTKRLLVHLSGSRGSPGERFLILTQYFPPEIGAAQIRLGAMVRELVRQGHSIEVVTAFPNYPTGEVFPKYRNRFSMSDSWEGVPVYRTWIYPAKGAGFRRMLNYGSFTLSSFIGQEKPDCLL
jgi:hypothetical protein